MTGRRLLMVMPYRQFVRKAKEQGWWVGALWDPTLETPEYLAEVRELADAFALADFGDDEALRTALSEMTRTHAVDTIYHIGREDSMVTAYEVAERWGAAPNPASAVRLLVDKQAMRALLARRGLSAVDFAVAANRQDVPAAVARVGLPAVVKPTALAGSRGVYLWRGPEDEPVWTELVEGYGYAGPFLVEEYLRGPEYSIETLSHDGHHTVVGITGKQLGPPPLFVETGHVHPAPLSEHRRAAIERLTVDLLDACGYRFGPAHTEVIWTERGPRIVESQARLGGDRIPRLVELSTGLDIERAIFAGLAGDPASAAPHTATAVVRFFTFPPGRVDAVHGLAEVRALDHVDELVLRLRPGDVTGAVRDSKSRQGHVIVSGATAEQAHHRLARVLSTIEVVVDGVAVRADGTTGGSAVAA